jgi:RHS repeat-associated protein
VSGAKSAAAVPSPTPGTSQVAVTLEPHAKATSAGINGVVMTLGQADGGPSLSSVQVSLSYAQFADAYGGSWDSRLALVELPACALTTPKVAACRVQTPVAFTNDAKTQSLTASVMLPAASTTTTPGLVLAATATTASDDAGSGAGNFAATSLNQAQDWAAGGSADAFSWTYPISVPQVPGGLTPSLALGYNSQAVDGLTSNTNNQAGIEGDGWDLTDSYIERSFTSCHNNPSGPTQTYDTCWSNSNTLTLDLNGQITPLVQDDTSGAYHPQADAGERIQDETGASNGAQNGEYWVLTSSNGTQYYFGLNQLPGYASGDASTNSVETEPVYATASGQPCYNATFADSYCQQAYRWNLDYVVDTHQDTVSYWYTTTTGYYAQDLGTTAANTSAYTRDSYLSKIQYGQRAGQVYSSTPAGQVAFTVNGRCASSPTGCATSTLSSSTASNWPDVPDDAVCAEGTACSIQTPTFFSLNELSGIETYALDGTSLDPVDSWALTYSLPTSTLSGDTSTPALWLNSIQQTALDTSAAPSGSSSIQLPPVSFSGIPMTNQASLSNGYPWITRYRLNEIVTETGEKISVNYSAPACQNSTPANDAQNTMLCYPVWWYPTGAVSPVEDYFNVYIVDSVTEQDPTGGSANDTIQTTYTPVGSPAWHYDYNPLIPATQLTWDQWRGYPGMTVSTGTAPDPITDTQHTYFQGMDGDYLSSTSTRSITLTDSRGDPGVPDLNQYAGTTYETQVFNGASQVTDTIDTPWSSSATASHAEPGGVPALQSSMTGTAQEQVYTPLANGTTRQTETQNTFDAYGRITQVNDLGDVSTPADDLCTTTSYATNTSAWILDLPSEVSTVSVNCQTTAVLPTNAVSDTLTFYDGSTTLGAAPSVGDVTMTQQAASYTGTTPKYLTTSIATVDEYGRTVTSTDADGNKATTLYTPTTGAEPTAVKVTDPMGLITTTDYDPLQDLPTTVTDPGGFTTSEQYDALGLPVAEYDPGQPLGSGGIPNLKYTYTLSNTGPSITDVYTLQADSSYSVTETLYDSMLRAREVQTQTPDNSRDITDTTYNTDGWVSESTALYHNANPVSPTYVQAQAGDVPSATGYTYDGAGRETSEVAYADANAPWQTSYVYGGNYVTTIPPAGATATTSVTNARGEQTDLIGYHAGVPTDYVTDPASDYTDTQYTYTPAGQQATETDAAGDSWSWNYDLLGDQTDAFDPDTGHTLDTYDNNGNVLTSTDARGDQTTYVYDKDGRKTADYDTTSTQTLSSSNKLASWLYDTVKKGMLSSSTSYSNGDVYTDSVLAYAGNEQPEATKVTLTGTDAALVPTAGYTTSYGYTVNGLLNGQDDPAMGALPSENIGYTFDDAGDPTTLSSDGGVSGDYVNSAGYSEFGQPLLYTFGSAPKVYVAMAYDPQTFALTGVTTSDDTASGDIDNLQYVYKNSTVSQGAGLVTEIQDSQNAATTVDTQCFTYDYAERLTQAWSATDNCKATPSPGNSSTVGGTDAPYWQSWTYDAAGDRATETDHDVTGNTANDTTATYTYPTHGSSTDQPNTLSSTSATGPNAAANTASYTYDADGNTTKINGGTLGNQTLSWNNQDQLQSDTTSAGSTSYVYDADGNLLAQRDPGSTTLYLGDAQLVLNTATGAITGTRYYTFNGQVIAERTSAGQVNYLIPDRQNTDELAINANAAQTVTRRQYLPFGTTRGTASTWVGGDQGYVGGTTDTATNLENLGAREYDPATGRFLSADPLLETEDPTQLGGYDYAGNNPTTSADPIGLQGEVPFETGGGGSAAGNEANLNEFENGKPVGAGGGAGGGEGDGEGRSDPNDQSRDDPTTSGGSTSAEDDTGAEYSQMKEAGEARAHAQEQQQQNQDNQGSTGDTPQQGNSSTGSGDSDAGVSVPEQAQNNADAEAQQAEAHVANEQSETQNESSENRTSSEASGAKTQIFRNVDEPEFDSIASTGKFDTGEGQMEGKWFATTGEHADQWGDVLNGGQGVTVETRIPSSLANQLHFEPGKLDGIGPGFYAQGDQLDLINESMDGIRLWQ